MASEKVSAIIESIEGLNVLELVDLKKSMEEKWGVTAAAPEHHALVPLSRMSSPPPSSSSAITRASGGSAHHVAQRAPAAAIEAPPSSAWITSASVCPSKSLTSERSWAATSASTRHRAKVRPPPGMGRTSSPASTRCRSARSPPSRSCKCRRSVSLEWSYMDDRWRREGLRDKVDRRRAATRRRAALAFVGRTARPGPVSPRLISGMSGRRVCWQLRGKRRPQSVVGTLFETRRSSPRCSGRAFLLQPPGRDGHAAQAFAPRRSSRSSVCARASQAIGPGALR